MNDHYNQEVIWTPTTGAAYGDRAEGTPKTVLMRWEGKVKLLTDAQGRQVTSTVRAYTDEDVRVGDLLTYNGQTVTVLQVAPKYALDGELSHREVYG